MNQDDDLGTNRNGSRNGEYCRFCFQEGHFTDEGITVENKIAKNILLAKKMGIPEDQARQMAETIIPQLKRWQTK